MGKLTDSPSPSSSTMPSSLPIPTPSEPPRRIVRLEYEYVEWREALAEYKARILRSWRNELTAEDIFAARQLKHFEDLQSDVETDAPILGADLKPRKRLMLKGRTPKAVALVIMMGFFYLIYFITFYATMFVMNSSVSIVESVKLASASVHEVLTESYEDYRNPGNPQEIADLMTEWYELLSKMGYYENSAILRPPHGSAVNITKAVENGFTQRAIEMMDMLPYIGNADSDDRNDIFAWSHGVGDYEFMLYGTFVDYRDNDFLTTPRDPLWGLDMFTEGHVKDWNEDGGPYMRPSYIELLANGNHGTIMVLNTDNWRIWTIDDEGTNADPATEDIHLQEKENRLDLNNFPSRPARLVLRDYIQKFTDLEWMPGGLMSGGYDGDSYAELYLANGWPSNFDRAAFMTARAKWEEDDSKRYSLEEPYEKLRNMEQRLKQQLGEIEWKQKQIAQADAGISNDNDQNNRDKLREYLVTESALAIAGLPKVQADLEAAREEVRKVDPAVRKAREERIAKYGN